MTLKASVYIATSLDGFIAREDGDIDWLNEASAGVPKGEDCGYAAFMSSVDVLVMGRKTYETVMSFGGDWPYGAKPVVVLSSTPISFPDNVPDTVSHSSEAPRELCDRLNHEGHQHIYVDGGHTIQRFLADGLIDEITITIIPVLLGDGIRLFGSDAKDISLTCLETTRYDFGFVQLKYGVSR